MSKPSALAKLALRHLADSQPDIVPPTRADVDAAVEAIASELESTRRRRDRRRVLVGALAVAASVLVLLGSLRAFPANRGAATVSEVSGGVLVMRGAEGATLERGEALAKGDRIVASGASRATLALPGGSELVASAGADILVAEHGRTELFELRAGSIDLHVAKLEAGDRFIIRTPDSEVEVRGTRFRVDITERCNGTTTHVNVTEGVVLVRHGRDEARVTAGESWPAPCSNSSAMPVTQAPITAPPAPASTATIPSTHPTAIKVAPSASTGPVASATAMGVAAPPMTSSELAEQNRLYAEAMAAKRRGDAAAALGSLDRLLASHPHGPLAESASVERMRIVAVTDPARASEAARAYLARHPNGYAKDEARRLAEAP
jgi:hypothetical protein